MGPLRRGLIVTLLALIASPAAAQVCSDLNPDWSGETVTSLDQLVLHLSTFPALILMVGTAFAIRLRQRWIGLVVVVLWTIYATIETATDGLQTKAQALAEGCVGSSTLFLALVTAICVGVILYTAPPPMRKPDGANDA